jgi:hypothetical protein
LLFALPLVPLTPNRVAGSQMQDIAQP